MKNFNTIAQSILNNTCSGIFRLRNNEHIPSTELSINDCTITGYDYPYRLGHHGKTYTSTGLYYYGKESPFDVMEFIKDVETTNIQHY